MDRICSLSICVAVEGISCGAAEKGRRTLAPDCGAGAGEALDRLRWTSGTLNALHLSFTTPGMTFNLSQP